MKIDKILKKAEKKEAAIYLDKFAWVGFSGIRQTDIIQAERYVTTKDNWEPTRKTFHCFSKYLLVFPYMIRLKVV